MTPYPDIHKSRRRCDRNHRYYQFEQLAYLGYEDEDDGLGKRGLLYYGGDGGVVKGNHIHHLRFGFYSSGVGGILLENNNVHDSTCMDLTPTQEHMIW